ncbi:MAG TPA: lipocalin-like domain-containing protein [Dehalococcoidia bacterium]
MVARDGRRFGFELVFFRQGERRASSDNPSVWRIDDLYLAHLALTDIDGRRFRSYRRLNRAGPGIAGASLDLARVWNGNWEARLDLATGAQTLSAIAEGIRFHLRLAPRKPPVIHGENGVSQKAEGEGHASYYVSFTRLDVAGQLNGEAVHGTAWMDHEWFSSQLAQNQRGWDWFSVQLDDGTDLMLFQLRRMDRSIDPYSSGTFVDRNGRAVHLRREDFKLDPVGWWTSPKTGARYPVKWRITVPSLHLALECSAAIPAQELASEDRSAPAYWEGAVVYGGTPSGVGYLEMTGYAAPMRI